MPCNAYGDLLCRPPAAGPLQWGLPELLPTSSCPVQGGSDQICPPQLEPKPLLILPWGFWICCSFVLWLWHDLCPEHHLSLRWSTALSVVSLEGGWIKIYIIWLVALKNYYSYALSTKKIPKHP